MLLVVVSPPGVEEGAAIEARFPSPGADPRSVTIGLLLQVDEVEALKQRWPTVIGGTAVQYTCMPLLAWMMVLIFRPDAETAAGIMIVGCVPGAVSASG